MFVGSSRNNPTKMNKVAASELKVGMTFKWANWVCTVTKDPVAGCQANEVVIGVHVPAFTLRRKSNGNRLEKHSATDTTVKMRRATQVVLR
jgi:hypothetical protein